MQRNEIKKKRKRRKRKRILMEKEEELKNMLKKAKDVVLPDDMFNPSDNIDYNWDENEQKVCSLGLKFVPTIRRHNAAKNTWIS